MKYDTITYQNKRVTVIKVKYKNADVPVLIDTVDLAKIRGLDKAWRINKLGFVSCEHVHQGESKDVYLHELIMTLKMQDSKKKILNKPIIHLNRIGLDNRRANLMYDTVDKDKHKNTKKKERTITLPKNSKINPSEIPTYVWYMKPDSSHGDRFMVDVDDVQWKTTSSKKVSLRYKLEEAKAYLRELKMVRPELFTERSMNGDYTAEGKKLLNSYYDIVHKVGYTNMEREVIKDVTIKMLKPGRVNSKEKDVLNDMLANSRKLLNGGGNGGGTKRRVVVNLPRGCGVVGSEIPEYCYYHPATVQRGGYFVVKGHPDQGRSKVWQSRSGRGVSVRDKLEDVWGYLDRL